MGIAYQEMNNFSQAKKHYQDAVALNPNFEAPKLRLVGLEQDIADSDPFRSMTTGETFAFCSAALGRSSGLINENINKFIGPNRASLAQVSNHLSNNSMTLLTRAAMAATDCPKKDCLTKVNDGRTWANRNIGKDLWNFITKEQTLPYRVVMKCQTLAK